MPARYLVLALVCTIACTPIQPLQQIPQDSKEFLLASDELLRQYPAIKQHHHGHQHQAYSYSVDDLEQKWGKPDLLREPDSEITDELFWGSSLLVLLGPNPYLALGGAGLYGLSRFLKVKDYPVWHKGDYTIEVETARFAGPSKITSWRWYYQGLDTDYAIIDAFRPTKDNHLGINVLNRVDSKSSRAFEIFYSRSFSHRNSPLQLSLDFAWYWTKLDETHQYLAFPIGIGVEKKVANYSLFNKIIFVEQGKIVTSLGNRKDKLHSVLFRTGVRHTSGISLFYQYVMETPHDSRILAFPLAVGAQLSF